MYRSHRRIRSGEEEDVEDYAYQADDLTVYETAEGLDVNFKLRVLADLLKCPICKGYFREAMTIRECLHTFCRSCICQHIHMGGEKCPKCNERLPSNLNDGIEFDRAIQNIVDKMFPQFAEIEELERRELYTYCGMTDELEEKPSAGGSSATMMMMAKKKVPNSNSTHNNSSSTTTTTTASTSTIRTDSSSGSSSNNKRPRESASRDGGGMATTSDSDGGGWEATKEFFSNVMNSKFKLAVHHNISCALLPWDNLQPLLSRPYLRTSSQMQVLHVMKYLNKKLHLTDPLLYVEVLLEGQVLPKSHTLEFVCRSRRLDHTKCILIKYRVVSKKGTSSPSLYYPAGMYKLASSSSSAKPNGRNGNSSSSSNSSSVAGGGGSTTSSNNSGGGGGRGSNSSGGPEDSSRSSSTNTSGVMLSGE